MDSIFLEDIKVFKLLPFESAVDHLRLSPVVTLTVSLLLALLCVKLVVVISTRIDVTYSELILEPVSGQA